MVHLFDFKCSNVKMMKAKCSLKGDFKVLLHCVENVKR